MIDGINKIMKMRFCLLLVIIFGLVLVTNANGSTAGDINNPEFVKKVLEFVEEGAQAQISEINPASEQVFDLLKQVSDELNKDKTKLFEIAEGFGDLCNLLGKIEEPKRHHIRALKEKIASLDSLIAKKDEDVVDSDEALISKIKTLIILLKSLLENENLNLGGFGDLLFDVVYHRPIEFVSENKVPFSFLALVLTVAGGYWKLKDESDTCNSFSKTLKSFFEKEKPEKGQSVNRDEVIERDEVIVKKNQKKTINRSVVKGKKVGGRVPRARTKVKKSSSKESIEMETVVAGHRLRYREGLTHPARYYESDDEDGL